MKKKQFLTDLVRDYEHEEIESLIQKDKDVIFKLLDLLKDKESEIRCGVLAVLYDVLYDIEKEFFQEIKEELKNRFLPLLKDPNPKVRANAIDGIFNINDVNSDFELSEDKSKFLEDILPQLVETSYELLEDVYPIGIQRSAAFSLKCAAWWFLGPKEDYETTLGILLKLARNRDEIIREKAIYFAKDYARSEFGKKDQKLLEKIDLLIKETAGYSTDKKEKGLDSKMIEKSKELYERDKKKIKHYDEIGILKGYSIEKGAKTTHFDEIGVPNGYSIEKGAKTTHFDEIGVPRGYSIKKGTKITHFDEIGVPNGYSIEKGGKIKHFDKYGIPKGKDERKKNSY